MSTVRGKKSAPSRTDREAVAVANRTVSPMRATTAPSANWANLPVSNESVRSVPLMGADTVMASDMTLLVVQGFPVPAPSCRPPDGTAGDRQLVTDLGGNPVLVLYPSEHPCVRRLLLRADT